MEKSTHKAEVIPLVVEKHPNADKLGIVRNGGYTLVINVADWADTNVAVHILPDSIVDVTRQEFKWLDKGKGERFHIVKPVKLRGVVSYGLLVRAPSDAKVGDDVADKLQVKHYEPESVYDSGDNVKAPVYFTKYDVDTAMKYGYLFTEGETVHASEKIHGCLHANSLITTPNGQIKIQDIESGQSIISYNEAAKQFEEDVVVRKIINDSKQYLIKDWIEIELINGTKLVCTSDHPILTKCGYIEAGLLTEKDDIIIY